MRDVLALEGADGGSGLCAAVAGAGAERRDDMPGPAARALALAVALALLIAFAASSFTVAEDLHHDCTGDGCAVCAQMAGCLHIARGGATLATGAIVLAAALLRGALAVIGRVRPRLRTTALVAQKVQLND